MATDTYLMGRSEQETRRLMTVATLLEPLTLRFLHDAGLAEGMRVLDVGTGPGDVALLAARIVGSTGTVVGLDQDPEILRTAFARAQVAGLDQVSFLAGDCATAALPGPFDAVVGRLVVMYLPDPVATVRRLAEHVVPGGIVAFQDYNLSAASVRTSPQTPLWTAAADWVVRTAARVGMPAEVGFGLRRTFLDAGLPEPELRLEAYVGGGPGSPAYEWMAESVRSMLPLITRFGVATEDEIGVDTLAERLRDETVAAGGVVKAPDLVGAWTRS